MPGTGSISLIAIEEQVTDIPIVAQGLGETEKVLGRLRTPPGVVEGHIAAIGTEIASCSACARTFARIHTFTFSSVHTHTPVHTCMHTHICRNIHTHIRRKIERGTHTHIYTHKSKHTHGNLLIEDCQYPTSLSFAFPRSARRTSQRRRTGWQKNIVPYNAAGKEQGTLHVLVSGRAGKTHTRGTLLSERLHSATTSSEHRAS